MKRSRTYKLLEAFLPGVRVFVFLRADLVKPAWLRVHHGTRILKHIHVQTLPGRGHTSNQHVLVTVKRGTSKSNVIKRLTIRWGHLLAG